MHSPLQHQAGSLHLLNPSVKALASTDASPLLWPFFTSASVICRADTPRLQGLAPQPRQEQQPAHSHLLPRKHNRQKPGCSKGGSGSTCPAAPRGRQGGARRSRRGAGQGERGAGAGGGAGAASPFPRQRRGYRGRGGGSAPLRSAPAPLRLPPGGRPGPQPLQPPQPPPRSGAERRTRSWVLARLWGSWAARSLRCTRALHNVRYRRAAGCASALPHPQPGRPRAGLLQRCPPLQRCSHKASGPTGPFVLEGYGQG